MDYRLVRTRRKTLAIHITAEAAVEVRAPLRLAQATIDVFVQQKQGWVLQHQQAALQRLQARAAYLPADTLPLLGVEYPFTHAPCKEAMFDGERFTLPPEELLPRKTAAELFYRRFAKEYLSTRVAQLAQELRLVPTAVKVNGAATRWGSCSAKNSLNFSWRLVLAPPAAVDYVVVHELAHICQHNHSAAFWRVVADALPDYQQRQTQLKQTQRRLSVQGWL